MSSPSPASPAPASGVTPAVLGAIAVTVLSWASAFIVIRGVGPYFSGGALALARLLVGTALLPGRWRRWGFAGQVVFALLVQHLLFTGW